MPDNQNKLIQFWQELKRRKVIYVITVYASAAFVIIELINNLGEPLNLPESLATIVIIHPLRLMPGRFSGLEGGSVEDLLYIKRQALAAGQRGSSPTF